MSEPIKWPKLDDFKMIDPASAGCTHDFHAFRRAETEAAIARLRIAVEALGVVAAQDSGKPGSTARADCMAITAKQALNAIGEIPE